MTIKKLAPHRKDGREEKEKILNLLDDYGRDVPGKQQVALAMGWRREQRLPLLPRGDVLLLFVVGSSLTFHYFFHVVGCFNGTVVHDP